jgi:hypothetical protein
MHLLAGAGDPATAGAALLVDMVTLATRREPFERRLDCEVCTNAR